MQRLDLVVSELLPQYSRARLQRWIKAGSLTVNGVLAKPRDKVRGGEKIVVSLTLENESDMAEDIPLEIVYEDHHLLVVDKPPDLVVHPGAGNPSGTLLNGLLGHLPELANIPRAGIVHRLDKATSGLLVVAKTLETQNYLVTQIQTRKVSRIYHAIVYGVVSRHEGVIEGAIGRHPAQRKKMAIRRDGKVAKTSYRVLDQFAEHALIECKLDTGRTHQIRVHLQSIGYPLVGDAVYGGTYRRPRVGNADLELALRDFGRQALHARKLALIHPETGRSMQWTSPHPADFEELLAHLRG